MSQKIKKKKKRSRPNPLTIELTVEERRLETHKKTLRNIKKAIKIFPQVVEEHKQRHRERKPFWEYGTTYKELLKMQQDREKKRKVPRK